MVIISFFNVFLSMLLTNLLFCLVGATINKSAQKLLLLVLSVFSGAVFATLELLMIPQVGLTIVAVVLFSCSVVVLFYPQNFLSFVILEVVVLAYILVGIGVSYLVQFVYFSLFKINSSTYVIYSLMKNIVLFLMGWLIYYLFKINYRKKEILNFVFEVLIELAGRRVKLKMFLDSGNMLYDSKTNLPVFVINKSNFEKKLGYMIVEEECRQIQYLTISGENRGLAVIKPDNIFINKAGRWYRVSGMLGVVDVDFKLYDGLLHSSVA